MKSIAVIGDQPEVAAAARSLGLAIEPDAAIVVCASERSAEVAADRRLVVVGDGDAPRAAAILTRPVGAAALAAVVASLRDEGAGLLPAAMLGAATVLGPRGTAGATALLAEAFRADDCRLEDTGSAVPRVGESESRCSALLPELGWLTLRWDGPHCPNAHERAALAAVAGRLAAELSLTARHARVVAENARLRAAALVDEVTGVWTHDQFLVELATEIGAAKRRKEALSLVVVDVEHLRAVNTRHGHEAGDAVLAHIASTLRGNVRGHDVVGRIGDDELGVVLLGSPLEASAMVAEKLRRLIVDRPVVLPAGELPLAVTMGVTAIDHNEEAIDAIARARAAQRREEPTPVRVAAGGDTASDMGASATSTMVLGGQYRVLHELGRGELSVTYRATDLGSGREVALKVLRADVAAAHDEWLEARADALAGLRHPNLADLLAFKHEGEDAFFVLALVEGEPLDDIVPRMHGEGSWLPLDSLAEIARQLGEALDLLAAEGLVHGAVKPSSVIITRDDRAVLADVGLPLRGARLDTGPDGAPGFAAPELAESDATPAADVYGLAATLYYALCGEAPFGAGDDVVVLARQLVETPQAPSGRRGGLPAGVDAVLMRALSPEPTARQPSAGTLVRELASALAGAEHTEIAPPRPPPPSRPAAPRAAVRPAREARPEEVTGHVRGALFRAAQSVLATRVSPAWLARTARDARTLAPLLSPTLAPTSWHPLALLVDLIERARGSRAPVEVLARAIGRAAVDSSITRFFAADLAGITPTAALRGIDLFWPRYHGWSRAKAQPERKDRVRIVVTGDPLAPLTGEVVSGMLARVAELAGARQIKLWQQPWVAGPGAENVVAVEWGTVERHPR